MFGFEVESFSGLVKMSFSVVSFSVHAECVGFPARC